MARTSRRLLWALVSATATVGAFGPGLASAQTVKIGILGPFSGPFAHYGTLFKTGAEAYLESQGGKLAAWRVASSAAANVS